MNNMAVVLLTEASLCKQSLVGDLLIVVETIEYQQDNCLETGHYKFLLSTRKIRFHLAMRKSMFPSESSAAVLKAVMAFKSIYLGLDFHWNVDRNIRV